LYNGDNKTITIKIPELIVYKICFEFNIIFN
jgi:hypothetical protein